MEEPFSPSFAVCLSLIFILVLAIKLNCKHSKAQLSAAIICGRDKKEKM